MKTPLPSVLSDRLRQSQRGSFVWHPDNVVPNAAPTHLSVARRASAGLRWPSPPDRHHSQNYSNTTEPQIAGTVLTCESDDLGSARSISTNKPPTTNKVYQSFALFSSARPRRREEPRPAAQNRAKSGSRAGLRWGSSRTGSVGPETTEPNRNASTSG